MAIAYIGIGANLGDREANLRTALDHLRETGAAEVLAVSRLVEADAVGGPSQPRYLNGAAKIRTDLEPHDLLRALKEAERRAGRKPSGVRWGPREADLDLLLYGSVVVRSPDLVVPHPLLRERHFVLAPLAEIAPDVRDPVTGKTMRELLFELSRRVRGRRMARLSETIAELREYVAMAKRNRFSLGLVPTMGALHEGHLSLVRAARAECDKVVVSVFVNPIQFGRGEDLARYPRSLEQDLALSSDAGADLVFAPSVAEMYRGGTRTFVDVEGVTKGLCGASRPGHFRGVATVVAKLMNLAEPDVAYFGQKDWQQTVVIRRMVADLDFPLAVRVLPTVREPDGLALSSRNAYLDAVGRRRATCLSAGLFAAKEAYEAGERNAQALASLVRSRMLAAEVTPEYVEVRDAEDLDPVDRISTPAVIAVAARVGETRLIDNVLLGREP